MHSVFGFVPIGRLNQGKSRLASRLNPPQRAELIMAMLEDVLSSMSESGCFDRMGVVTPDACVADWARRHHLVVLQQDSRGLSGASEFGMRWAAEAQFCTAVVVMGDLPQATPEEMQRLGKAAMRNQVVIVPDHMGDRTSALAMSPPGSIPSSFGEMSRVRHRLAAAGVGLRVAELNLPGMAQDVDVPEDLDRVRVTSGMTFHTLQRFLTPRG